MSILFAYYTGVKLCGAAGGLRIPLQFQEVARLVLDRVPLAIPQRKCRPQVEGPPDKGSCHCIVTWMILGLQSVISAGDWERQLVMHRELAVGLRLGEVGP